MIDPKKAVEQMNAEFAAGKRVGKLDGLRLAMEAVSYELDVNEESRYWRSQAREAIQTEIDRLKRGEK